MSSAELERFSIHVLAGTNGAGKSSVAGALLRRRGLAYYNPDEATRDLMQRDPGLGLERANSRAWKEGVRRLRDAINDSREFAFETTLGGTTITRLLQEAHRAGLAVRVHYVGLRSADLHVSRVRARVARGGHDIPVEKIRARYVTSRENLLSLLPALTELVLWDNSKAGDPTSGVAPEPLRILHYLNGVLAEACPPKMVPEWAKPIYAAVYDLAGEAGTASA